MVSSQNELSQSKAYQLPIDVFAIVSFICSLYYFYLFTILIDSRNFPVTSFLNRIIGVGILNGVDTAIRTKFYLFAIISTGVLAIFLVIAIEKYFSKIMSNGLFNAERNYLAFFSILGITNLFLFFISKNHLFQFNLHLIFTLMCCLIFLIIVKNYSIKFHKSEGFLKDFHFMHIFFTIPFVTSFLFLVLKNDGFIIDFYSLVIYFYQFLILIIIYYIYLPKINIRIFDPNYRNILICSLVPICFYPVSIPLTNELQFWLSRWLFIDARILSLIIFILFIMMSFMLYHYQLKEKRAYINIESCQNNYVLPAILSALIIFSNYVSGGSFTQVLRGNVFEHGLTSTVIQQLFDYGAFPQIDIANPHGFMDIYSPILYSFINGYYPFDCFLWSWITPLLVALLSYFLLKEFMEGSTAFFLVIFLPLLGILPDEHCIIIFLSAILFVKFLRNSHLCNFILLELVILFGITLRPEAGIASLFAVLLITFLMIYSKLGTDIKKNLNFIFPYCISTITILIIFGFIFIFLCYISDTPLISPIIRIINMYIINDPSGTYPDLFSNYDIKVVLQYALFPLFSLSILVFFIWSLLFKRNSFNYQLIIIVFISIASLFLSQRGIQRHSLMESFSLFYTLVLACLIPFVWCQQKKIFSIIFLIIILICGGLITQIPLNSFQTDFSNSFFSFNNWHEHENRVQIHKNEFNEYNGVYDLGIYLQQFLKHNETYYDLSNFLLPFTILRKEYIPHSVITPNAGEWFQNETIQSLRDNLDNIPIVITGGWHIDGIPTEFRNYRIAEYIYNNYRPIGKIDMFEVWLRNDLNQNLYTPNLGQVESIPFLIETPEIHNIKIENKNSSIILQSENDDPYIANLIFNRSYIQKILSASTTLNLFYYSDTNGQIQIFYSINGSPYCEKNSMFGNIYESKSEENLFSITIPHEINNITSFRMDPPNNSNLTLRSGFITPSFDFKLDTKINRDFSLKKLPYIWGTFDSYSMFLKKPIMSLLKEGGMNIGNNEPILFSNIPNIIDKKSGNYLYLRIKSDEAGDISIKYGNDPQSQEIPAIINFNLHPNYKSVDYLIRISSQWEWYQEVKYFELVSSVPIFLEKFEILKGD
ncbi:hypothetical protein KSK55_09090 [Methanospirillum purgamenti]|uniref:Uncharacterized protein n=1 Tax=Methanospirillum hungatei TaxID=2203 RepID=A0A8F5ZDB6_METHU|nr:hypothetical protein [Methanospirillum hungatei]QXO93537.1 hypothetical protein KSK55_09090 [Methanospirillum hungatei]